VSHALPAPPLLFITDRLSTTGDLVHIAGQVFHAGCRWLMVREKDLDTAALGALAGELVSLARPFDACVVVNGNIEAALSAGAAGVHLQSPGDIAVARETLGDEALIGVSCHSPAELQAAMAAGADYATYSPVFLTASKPGYGPAHGLDGLAAVCEATPIPVVALAGISEDNSADCLRAGAAGVAVMGGIMRSDDPADVVRGILHAIGG
jgi:thiamine-phosphate pyrophosphorylase